MTEENVQRYKYTPLEPREIRTIHLQPGEGDSTIFIEVSTKRLDDPDLKYNALSWQWGDQPSDAEIRIRDKPGSSEPAERYRKMNIKPNLCQALKRLRSPDSEIQLWVDAVCIQQMDDKSSKKSENAELEKSKQISMMTDIYSKAHEVKVWLGEPAKSGSPKTTEDYITEEDVTNAVSYIKELANLDDTNHIAGMNESIRTKASSQNIGPLFKLLRCGWFGRRWVVQEIGVARSATLHCGKNSVPWENLVHATALLERVNRDGTVNKMLKTLPTTHHVSEYLGNTAALPAYRLVQTISGLSQERKGVKLWQYTLEQLVCFLAAFQASLSHDTIYAILGIASDFKPITKDSPKTKEKEPGGFVVDYTESALEVFKRFLQLTMDKSKSLDILCRPWAPVPERDENGKEKEDWPSWIPTLKKKPFQATKGRRMVRYNADPFVGAAIPRLRFYTASGLQNPELTKGFFEFDKNDKSGKSLIVKAFELASIGEIWDTAIFGNIPASWLSAGGWESTETPPPDELWRTLVADRTQKGEQPDPWYPMAFQSSVRENETRYGINTHQQIHEKNNAAYSEVFRRVQAVIWNRRLFRTTDFKLGDKDGSETWHYLGLAPEDAVIGDLVCIVLGCSVPLLLREQQPLVNANGRPTERVQQGKTYTLVGECYVDNMMDGQALRDPPKWDKFKIV